jgi:hypothetical protein
MRGCAGLQHVSPGVLICETHYLEDYKHLVAHVLHFLHLLFSFTKYQRMLTEYPSWFDKHSLRKNNNTTTAYAKHPFSNSNVSQFSGAAQNEARRGEERLDTALRTALEHGRCASRDTLWDLRFRT